MKRNFIEVGYEAADDEEMEEEKLSSLDQIKETQEEPLLPQILTRLISKRKFVKEQLKK